MKWYRKLYVGENARKAKYKIIGKVRTNRFQIDTFLIALSDHPDNLLDIYNANLLLQPAMEKSEKVKNTCVVGIAKGYGEALEVVRQIIDDVYSSTGDLKLREYFYM